ncbi:hypothetical protein CSHISOI_05100 [Colletotrichum shisoi]|uniref:Uncharacterized protein n=1 Tax=Colletotrichum shisoi TaxID=2078593 RepID=A0A5Q4BTK5_9PEZI|nr:hypothetical protein CSHISOI_05100 [Colletotrichum shisoi]
MMAWCSLNSSTLQETNSYPAKSGCGCGCGCNESRFPDEGVSRHYQDTTNQHPFGYSSEHNCSSRPSQSVRQLPQYAADFSQPRKCPRGKTKLSMKRNAIMQAPSDNGFVNRPPLPRNSQPRGEHVCWREVSPRR